MWRLNDQGVDTGDYSCAVCPFVADEQLFGEKPFAGNHDKQGVVGLTARRRRLDHEVTAGSVIRWLKCQSVSTHTSIE